MQLSPRAPGFVANPYPAYAAIHRHGEAVFWEEYGHWCFAGYDIVNLLLRDKRFGRQITHVASRAELGLAEPAPHLSAFDAVEAHSLLELEPPAHTRLRTLVNRAFVARQVEQMRPEIATLADRLIDTFIADGGVELLSRYAEIIPVTVIARMLGIAEDMAPHLLDWSHRMVRMYTFARDEAVEIDANAAARDFASFIRDEIAQRRANPDDDLISLMLTRSARDGEILGDDEIVSTAILLLNAGHEATVHQIGNAVATILEFGLCPRAMFADRQTTALAIEEMMRFDPPLHMFTRYALTDCEPVPGVSLRKGETIGLLLAAANRDPRRFPDPGNFIANRTEGTHLAFGAGIHFCLGAPLARLELQIALPALFARLPSHPRLATTPQRRDAYHFRGLTELQLVWDQ
ncbi:cytochrome P450 [Pseudohoeflea coraliihabitans]|uniref:Cytochrome P450 n=1 Tax=Pseudohoeflea coraliihabitans TaxID=2860393 RepID=A0ABS6WSG8_9HYPH|nr:cytochrome P450 [Pseudohoeflea sp. DP4N28-3]MBW3098896.1 cytochrome P450 [Pseudohoeflea sp. DP4N28-3]